MDNEQIIVLMHKDIPVAEFIIDAESGDILSNITVLNQEHLPLPVRFKSKNAFTAISAMQAWVAYRSVPDSRNNLENMLQQYGVRTPSAAAYKSLGLNLSDQYWYRPKEMEIGWEQVNLFTNDFTAQEFRASSKGQSSFISPDSNSNGELPKFWTVKNGHRLLYKQGSGSTNQQPYNEVFASKLLDILDLPHVQYGFAMEKSKPYSVCETFVDKDSEYIPAWDILGAVRQSNNQNAYQHFFRCVESLGISVNPIDINNILIVDYIINNVDRHYGNFGFIRDAATLEFKGLAPIFDNGNSLWYNVPDFEMITRNQPAKPFRDMQEKQLQLIAEFDIDFGLLEQDSIYQLANECFRLPGAARRITETRLESIIRLVEYNIGRVGRLLK